MTNSYVKKINLLVKILFASPHLPSPVSFFYIMSSEPLLIKVGLTFTNSLFNLKPHIQPGVKAINLLSNGKPPEADVIPAEVYKARGSHMALKLTEFFQSVWTQGTITQDYKNASIIHLWKWKGKKQI